MSNFISIAKILNFHGINGELKLGYTKGKEKQIQSLKEVYVLSEGNYVAYNVANVRLHKQFAIMQLKEFNNINEILKFKGENLYIPREEIEKNLEEDEYLIDDLIGSDVFNQNDSKIGIVRAVEENAAGSLLSIETTNKKNCLIPFINQFVTKVDIKNKLIVINEIEGLIE